MPKKSLSGFIKGTVFMVLAGVLSSVTQADSRTPLIIDTDMTSDDWLAILYLLADPNVEIKAITVSGTGQAHSEPGTRNLLNMLELTGYGQIPVATGSTQAIIGSRNFPEPIRSRADQFQGITLPESPRHMPAPNSATDLLISTISSSPSPVIVLTLGPWTNLAHALEKNPTIVGNIKRLIAMGGAIDVEGNIHHVPDNYTANYTAEWNFYLDPGAVHQVMQHELDIELIPLDATNYIPVTESLFATLKQQPESPALTLAIEILAGWNDRGTFASWYLWDPLAAVAVSHPEVVEFKPATVRINTSQTPVKGQDVFGALTCHPQGKTIRYAAHGLQDRFEALFTSVMAQHASSRD